jgi:hypothetical protein
MSVGRYCRRLWAIAAHGKQPWLTSRFRHLVQAKVLTLLRAIKNEIFIQPGDALKIAAAGSEAFHISAAAGHDINVARMPTAGANKSNCIS